MLNRFFKLIYIHIYMYVYENGSSQPNLTVTVVGNGRCIFGVTGIFGINKIFNFRKNYFRFHFTSKVLYIKCLQCMLNQTSYKGIFQSVTLNTIQRGFGSFWNDIDFIFVFPPLYI